ncbi:MAG: hypothetical protein IJ595_03005 [Oscillospiraceae bacterium]|nr:hypothetical protein [Oscillospiraceae bacterium]
MTKELDDLLSSLMQDLEKEQKKLPGQATRSTASEGARMRVEAILRDVERDTEKKEEPPAAVREPIPDLPVHDPVVIPPTVSHFTEEPSADTAVRMRDRLDAETLPKPDAERKPTQNHGLKPNPDRGRRKKYKRRTQSRSIPQPPVPPKKVIPHIEVPDELPPDIVPSPALREEPAQVALERAVSGEDTASAMIAVLTDKPAEPDPEDQIRSEAHKEKVRSKAEMIREQLRRRAEEEAAKAEAEETAEAEPEEILSMPEDPEKAVSLMPELDAVFPQEEAAGAAEEAEDEDLLDEELPEEPAPDLLAGLRGLFGRAKEFITARIFEEIEEDEEEPEDYPDDDTPYDFDEEEPIAEEPIAEEPIAEEPVAEEPIAEEPVAEEPIAEEPIAEEPIAKEPVAEEPIAEEPVAEEPIAEEPVAEEPIAEEPIAEEPIAEKPIAEEPTEEEPTLVEEIEDLFSEPEAAGEDAYEAPEDDEALYEEDEEPDEPVESAPKLRHLAALPDVPVKQTFFGMLRSLRDKFFEPIDDEEDALEDDEEEDDASDEEIDDAPYEFDEEPVEEAYEAPAEEPDSAEESPAYEEPQPDYEEPQPAEEAQPAWTATTTPGDPRMLENAHAIADEPKDYDDFSGDKAADEAYLALVNPEEDPLPNPPLPEEELPNPPMPEMPPAEDEDPGFDDSEYEAFNPPPQPIPPAPKRKRPKPTKAYKGFRAKLRAALDEDADELAEMKAEPLPEPEEHEGQHFLHRNSYFVVGVVCAVLAVVGLVTCVSSLLGWIGGFAGGGSVRDEITDVLYPVAVTDMPAFEAVGDIDDSYFLSAAMMDILMYDDLSVYPANFDVISIPLQDVLLRARRMFGAEYSPVPVTLRIAGEFFYYDEDIHSYNVPQSPAIFAYAPQIPKIQRSGDVYTVDVLYVSDSAQWQEHSSNYTAQNEKEMQVVLEKKNGVWRIVRIANTGDAADQS